MLVFSIVREDGDNEFLSIVANKLTEKVALCIIVDTNCIAI